MKILIAFLSLSLLSLGCSNAPAETEKNEDQQIENILKSDSAKMDSVERYWKEKMRK